MKIWYILAALVSLSASAEGGFMEQAFRQMDKNEDGYLEEDEMIPYLAEELQRTSTMDVGWLFDQYDTNKDDFVDKEEWCLGGREKTCEELEKSIKDKTIKESDRKFYEHELYKMDVCDKNKDGKLSRNEHWYFVNGASTLGTLEADVSWTRLDKDRDGKVDFEEFYDPEGVEGNESDFRASERAFFDIYDQNKDGIIEYREIKKMLSFDKMERAHEAYEEIMNAHDKNKDGRLSKTEFMKCEAEMSLFKPCPKQKNRQAPAETDDDVKGPPILPPSGFVYEKLYDSRGKDEL